MAKQILMDLEEHNDEMNTAFTKGFAEGRFQMVDVVSKILSGEGDKVTLGDKAEPQLKAFVAMLRKTANLLPDGALNEETNGETDSGDPVVPDESPSEDSV